MVENCNIGPNIGLTENPDNGSELVLDSCPYTASTKHEVDKFWKGHSSRIYIIKAKFQNFFLIGQLKSNQGAYIIGFLVKNEPVCSFFAQISYKIILGKTGHKLSLL